MYYKPNKLQKDFNFLSFSLLIRVTTMKRCFHFETVFSSSRLSCRNRLFIWVKNTLARKPYKDRDALDTVGLTSDYS